MMREIKFRCWNSHSSVMHDWNELQEKNKIHLLAENKHPYPVMQFTGIKDANGAEIYEGDILKSYHYTDGEDDYYLYHGVRWSEKYHSWLALNLESKSESDGSVQLWVYLNQGAKHNCEVVGNIHQNPELMGDL